MTGAKTLTMMRICPGNHEMGARFAVVVQGRASLALEMRSFQIGLQERAHLPSPFKRAEKALAEQEM